MNPGELRHRITIQQPVEVVDSKKTVTGVQWQDVVSVWASVEPISGREYILLQNTQSEVSVRVRIRYLAGVTSAMRVVYDNRIFNIESVIDAGERHRELELMCVEKAGG